MTPIEFNEQIEILKSVFNEAVYRPARVNSLFEIVKDCEARSFRNAVDQWVADKSAPLGEAFKEFARKHHIGNAMLVKDRDPSIEPSCKECCDMGRVALEIHDHLKQFAPDYGMPDICAAFCHCKAGLAVRRKVERSDELRSVANRVLSPRLREWYRVTSSWIPQQFVGKSWAEHRKTKDQIEQIAETVLEAVK
jgi:hypothetical protein